MRLGEVEERDRAHEAVAWALERPELAQLMRDLYVSRDAAADARRFEASDEFRETLRIVRRRVGAGPAALLDLGCGNGVASWAFAQHGFDVIGVDVSTSELAGLGAAEQLRRAGRASFETVRADAVTLPFPDDRFDVVYCRQVLHHVGDLVSALQECARVLRPGGALVASREQVAETPEQLEELLRTHPLQHITRDEDAFPKRAYVDALSRAGFVSIEVLGMFQSPINYFPMPAEELPRIVGVYLGRPARMLARLIPSLVPRLAHAATRRHERVHYTLDTFVATRSAT